MLDAQLVQHGLAYARQELARPRHRLYERLQRHGADGLAAGNALEQSIAAARAVRRQVGSTLVGAGEEREVFLNAYCTYAAGIRGQELLGEHGKGLVDARLNFRCGEYELLDQLMQTVTSRIERAPIGSVAELCNAAFHWMAETAAIEGAREGYAELRSQIERTPITLEQHTLRGFRSGKEDAEMRYHGSLNDIVGNRELKRTLLGALHNVLSYDVASGTNPVLAHYPFPTRFLVDGKEGTGKTSTLRALAAEGQRIAKCYGLAFHIRTISNAFKSEYYSASAKNLREIFGEMQRGDASYLVLIEDIDTIFSSRAELRQRGGEDRAVLGEVLNLLEGVGAEERGNVLFIATTNCPTALDPAFASRLREHQLTATGPETAADYTQLFRQKLGNMGNAIAEGEWSEISASCMGQQFSGRAVRNIALQVLDERYGGPKPETWFAQPGQRETLLAQPPLNAGVLHERMLAYAKYEHDKRQQLREERIAELREEIAVRQAAEVPHGIPIG